LIIFDVPKSQFRVLKNEGKIVQNLTQNRNFAKISIFGKNRKNPKKGVKIVYRF